MTPLQFVWLGSKRARKNGVAASDPATELVVLRPPEGGLERLPALDTGNRDLVVHRLDRVVVRRLVRGQRPLDLLDSKRLWG